MLKTNQLYLWDIRPHGKFNCPIYILKKINDSCYKIVIRTRIEILELPKSKEKYFFEL